MITSSQYCKAIAYLTLLTSWEIWNERNVHVFHNKQVPTSVTFEKIKKVASHGCEIFE
jgi:hypothetical protein